MTCQFLDGKETSARRKQRTCGKSRRQETRDHGPQGAITTRWCAERHGYYGTQMNRDQMFPEKPKLNRIIQTLCSSSFQT